MEPDIKDWNDLGAVQAFTNEAEEMEFYQDHRDWLLTLMERDIPQAQRIRQFQGMILLWRGFKQGRFDRQWDAEERRWIYQPRQP